MQRYILQTEESKSKDIHIFYPKIVIEFVLREQQIVSLCLSFLDCMLLMPVHFVPPPPSPCSYVEPKLLYLVLHCCMFFHSKPERQQYRDLSNMTQYKVVLGVLNLVQTGTVPTVL